jgi:hypothetical protein
LNSCALKESIQEAEKAAEGMAQVVECLFSKHEALNSNPSTAPPNLNAAGFLKKIKIELKLFDPTILLLYRKEMEIYVHIKTCTWMFLTVLFITAQSTNNPSTDVDWHKDKQLM